MALLPLEIGNKTYDNKVIKHYYSALPTLEN